MPFSYITKTKKNKILNLSNQIQNLNQRKINVNNISLQQLNIQWEHNKVIYPFITKLESKKQK